ARGVVAMTRADRGPPTAPPLFYDSYDPPQVLHSFPTRRSSDLSERTRISPKYLEQIMRRLRTANIVRSHRGINGDGSKQYSPSRSEEHTSELQSRGHLVCRLLLEKKITTWAYLSPKHSLVMTMR